MVSGFFYGYCIKDKNSMKNSIIKTLIMEKNSKYTGYTIFAIKIIIFILLSFILIPQNLFAEDINKGHEVKLDRYIQKGGCIIFPVSSCSEH